MTEKIKQFCDYFNDQIRHIGNLGDDLYTRILWIVLLDTLSRAGCPSIEKNGDRFRSYILTYSNWPESERISIPQLNLKLTNGNFTNGRLFEEVSSKLSSWDKSSIYEATHDGIFADLELIASSDEKEILDDCRYVNLLWKLRNSLVHEFRTLGYGFTGEKRKRIYYHWVANAQIKEGTWELVFPKYLFYQLATSSLNRLEETLNRESRNPYDAYRFSSEWE